MHEMCQVRGDALILPRMAPALVQVFGLGLAPNGHRKISLLQKFLALLSQTLSPCGPVVVEAPWADAERRTAEDKSLERP